MSRFAGVRRWFHLDREVGEEVDDELAFHFARTVEELTTNGMSPEAARAEAHRRFGDLVAYRKELRSIDTSRRTEAQRTEYFAIWGRNLRMAVRAVRRNRGFAAVVALTLVLASVSTPRCSACSTGCCSRSRRW